MPSPDPVKLGSAFSGGMVFAPGGRLRTSDSGIDEATINVFYGGGAIPPLIKGATYGSIFGNGYLPDSYLLDAIEVTYLEAKVLGGTLTFRRPNPNLQGRSNAKIFVDSIINYDTLLSPLSYALAATGQFSAAGQFGFPEPTVQVKYNSTTRPNIGSGGLAQLYAQPGSSNAQGFPSVPDISVPVIYSLPPGSQVTYFNGSAVVTVIITTTTTFTYNVVFRGNPAGWQLVRLKSDPVAGTSFYDCEEDWRNYYYFSFVQLVSIVPPLPP